MVDAPDYFKNMVGYLLLINLNKDNGMMGKYISPNILHSCLHSRAIQTLKYKVEHQKTSCKHHAAPNFIEGP